MYNGYLDLRKFFKAFCWRWWWTLKNYLSRTCRNILATLRISDCYSDINSFRIDPNDSPLILFPRRFPVLWYNVVRWFLSHMCHRLRVIVVFPCSKDHRKLHNDPDFVPIELIDRKIKQNRNYRIFSLSLLSLSLANFRNFDTLFYFHDFNFFSFL